MIVIAECCSNIIPHLSQLEWIVDEIASTGATHLKVQLFDHRHFPESEWKYKRLVEFPTSLFPHLVHLCHQAGLKCGASVFDTNFVDLVEQSGGDFLKLATREWGNVELLDRCVSSRLPVIRSYDALKHPYIDSWNLEEDYFTIMACIPQYPAEGFRFPTSTLLGRGWSSHTSHWNDVIGAVYRGAMAIEKHIRFSMNDYESGWSLSVHDFRDMVKDINWAEAHR